MPLGDPKQHTISLTGGLGPPKGPREDADDAAGRSRPDAADAAAASTPTGPVPSAASEAAAGGAVGVLRTYPRYTAGSRIAEQAVLVQFCDMPCLIW